MAGLKQIKRRLGSVKNTRKITYAMKLVAAAKLRKVQEQVAGLRKFKKALQTSFSRVLGSLSDEQLGTPLNTVRPVKKVRLLVVGGFRGLAGGYNSNVNKQIEKTLEEYRAGGENPEFLCTVIGKKPLDFIRRSGCKVTREYLDLSDDVSTWPIEEIVGDLVCEFEAAEVDRTVVIYTEFKSAMSQTSCANEVLPLRIERSEQDEVSTDNICEPSSLEVYRALLPRLLRADVQYAALSSQASEHGSRMTAMDSATKNADDLASKLKRKYNKLRQSGITAELLDIIGGAEAVN